MYQYLVIWLHTNVGLVVISVCFHLLSYLSMLVLGGKHCTVTAGGAFGENNSNETISCLWMWLRLLVRAEKG